MQINLTYVRAQENFLDTKLKKGDKTVLIVYAWVLASECLSDSNASSQQE